MNHKAVKRLVLAGILVAVSVVGGMFSIPVGAAKIMPVQHMVNVLGGVLLGPGYAVSMAFVTSLIRNLLGTGTLLAFPGSMIGALLCGLLYKGTHKLIMAYVGEVAGTGILGAIAAWPIAALLLGKDAAAFTFVIPFLMSTAVGAAVSVIVLAALRRTTVLGQLEKGLQ
ncbi:MAG: energy coupling factor transporter S component ThiW [Intestinibacillus sp.]